MNTKVLSILFLKDLFLCRRLLFSYLLGAVASVALASYPQPTVSFIGFILALTVGIAMGIHMIGELVLDERKSQTLAFIMSLPVNAVEYAIAKISVVLLTYLIPWCVLILGTWVLTLLIPSANDGTIPAMVTVFMLLLASFSLQLAVAVVSESIGATIGVMVAGNVFFNLFMMKLFKVPEIEEVVKTDQIVWSPLILTIVAVELVFVVASLLVALLFQMRKRSFV